MSKLRCDISIDADGFVAGPNKRQASRTSSTGRRRELAERRMNRTFQPVGCTGLPVLKCVGLLVADVFLA